MRKYADKEARLMGCRIASAILLTGYQEFQTHAKIMEAGRKDVLIDVC